MNCRKLILSDKTQLENLITIIEDNLEHKDFWLPINQTSREHFFDDTWTEFYGMFDNCRLIGASALFYNKHEFGESLAQLNAPLVSVAEIGRSMVHPQYRGNNILYQINTELLNIAKERELEYILATIHPQNIPSQCSFKKLGFEKKCTYTKSNKFVRDIFLLKL